MPVFRWRESWEPFRDLERQVDRLLEGIPFPIPVLRLERQFPPVNLYELDEEYLLFLLCHQTDRPHLGENGVSRRVFR